MNEHYLFHGTKRNALAQIYTQGLTLRAAKKRNMLGPGLYATESSTKADQYTGKTGVQIEMSIRLAAHHRHANSQPKRNDQPREST